MTLGTISKEKRNAILQKFFAILLVLVAIITVRNLFGGKGYAQAASGRTPDSQEQVELNPEEVKPYGYDKPQKLSLSRRNDPVSDGVVWAAEWADGGNGKDLYLTVEKDGFQTMRFKPVEGTSGQWTWTYNQKVGFGLPGFGSTRQVTEQGRIEVTKVYPDGRLDIKAYKVDVNNPELEVFHTSGILFPRWEKDI